MKQSQADKIVAYMEQYGSITPLDALREFGCMRLASRICDIKRRGIEVKAVVEKSKNRNGETVRYARYSLCR